MTPRTIFARATGALPAAVAIIRISGSEAANALRAITGRALPRERMATLRPLYHPETHALLDTGFVLWMAGPGTVTGDDLVELHVHGSVAVVARIEAVLSALPGVLPAEAGAFTRRAYENGKIDLTQVEGLGDLLAAQTERQRAQAIALVEGGLRGQVETWQRRLLGLAANVEATLDMAGEEDVATYSTDITDAIRCLTDDIGDALQMPPAERLRDGVRVVIAGPPNAGKSALFNALLRREAAIVSSTAGTTRDVIEAPIDLHGVPIVLMDTAGLRNSDDPIERAGIDRAHARVAAADIVVWLGDRTLAPAGALIVAAKIDLVDPDPRDLGVSATTGAGLTGLRDAIGAAAEQLLPAVGSAAISAHARQELHGAIAALNAIHATDEVLQAESLRSAALCFDRITGQAGTEAMLNHLFAQFCVGK